MPKRSLADEAHDAARETVGGGEDAAMDRWWYRVAYEALVGRARRGRKRGWLPGSERDFYAAVIRVATDRLEEV